MRRTQGAGLALCQPATVPASAGVSLLVESASHAPGHNRSVGPRSQPWPCRATERQVYSVESGAVFDLARPSTDIKGVTALQSFSVRSGLYHGSRAQQ